MTPVGFSLLLAALIQEDAPAAAAWNAWRRSVDIQHLTWPDMQILPLLNGPRFEAWLADDPDAGILRGIVRRAWSEAQVRLGIARETLDCLEQAGCGPVTLAGCAGAYLRNQPSTAIRPILELRLLIPRKHLRMAAAAMQTEGWEICGDLPGGAELDRRMYVVYSRNGTRLYLHWRMLPVDSRRAAACERAFLAEHRAVEAIGKSFRILTPGHALLEALVDPEDSLDALAWQVDAALICREAIDWMQWERFAARYQPEVFDRMRALRAVGVRIPEFRDSASRAGLLLSGPLQEAWSRTAGAWARRWSAAMGK